ncbi:hypothetical protein AVEN_56366-1 [Araneus ventricosus]|uniref:Uncharacterized protein n=1 Tax=Araneus ventricosus TaxID=182803 RepID=A0A4Y2Q1F2_ARAVE|nr:hypothetical protein AVEN_56366-1 [Araneus ventricosus]
MSRDGPRNFESLSDDQDDTELTTPSPNFRTTPAGGRLASTYDLACSKPTYRTDLQWNRDLSLEPSIETETFPLESLDHRGLPNFE